MNGINDRERYDSNDEVRFVGAGVLSPMERALEPASSMPIRNRRVAGLRNRCFQKNNGVDGPLSDNGNGESNASSAVARASNHANQDNNGSAQLPVNGTNNGKYRVQVQMPPGLQESIPKYMPGPAPIVAGVDANNSSATVGSDERSVSSASASAAASADCSAGSSTNQNEVDDVLSRSSSHDMSRSISGGGGARRRTRNTSRVLRMSVRNLGQEPGTVPVRSANFRDGSSSSLADSLSVSAHSRYSTGSSQDDKSIYREQISRSVRDHRERLRNRQRKPSFLNSEQQNNESDSLFGTIETTQQQLQQQQQQQQQQMQKPPQNQQEHLKQLQQQQYQWMRMQKLQQKQRQTQLTVEEEIELALLLSTQETSESAGKCYDMPTSSANNIDDNYSFVLEQQRQRQQQFQNQSTSRNGSIKNNNSSTRSCNNSNPDEDLELALLLSTQQQSTVANSEMAMQSQLPSSPSGYGSLYPLREQDQELELALQMSKHEISSQQQSGKGSQRQQSSRSQEEEDRELELALKMSERQRENSIRRMQLEDDRELQLALLMSQQQRENSIRRLNLMQQNQQHHAEVGEDEDIKLALELSRKASPDPTISKILRDEELEQQRLLELTLKIAAKREKGNSLYGSGIVPDEVLQQQQELMKTFTNYRG